MTTDEQKAAELQEIGRCAYESIAEMVAALECDYDRLEELREERSDLAETLAVAEAEFAEGDAEQAEVEAARLALEEWDEDNGKELTELLKAAGDCEDREDAEERIQEDPLSIEVRSGWYSPGGEAEPEEYSILLSTGGPATRIVGDLGDHNEPRSATLQVQDWFIPWTDYRGGDRDTLLAYARAFYFGD